MSWFASWVRSKRVKILVKQVAYEVARMPAEECAFVVAYAVNHVMWTAADIEEQGDSNTASAVRTIIDGTDALSPDHARELYFATEEVLFCTQQKNRAMLKNLANSPLVSVEDIKKGQMKQEAAMRLLLARLSQVMDRSNMRVLKSASTKLRIEIPNYIDGAVREVHRLENLIDVVGMDGQSRRSSVDQVALKTMTLKFAQSFSL
ncbi:MAG: hypothetical protein ABI132_00080 [Rhodanobacteraceae bacterium]